MDDNFLDSVIANSYYANVSPWNRDGLAFAKHSKKYGEWQPLESIVPKFDILLKDKLGSFSKGSFDEKNTSRLPYNVKSAQKVSEKLLDLYQSNS